MQLFQAIVRWLRTRKKATTALTFDTLVERAMRGPQSTSGKKDRPDYLPNPGALSRIALAIGGGLCFYAAIATFVPGVNWGGSWWSLTLAAPVLCILALRLGNIFEDSCLKSGSYLIHSFGDGPLAVLRTLFWPITEPLCVLIGWVCTYLYYALDRVLPHWEQEPAAREAQKASTREDAIRRIPDLIVAIIAEERERLFGDASPFAGIRKRIEAELAEARQLHAYFTKRDAETGAAERRRTAIERAAAVRDQLDGERTRLDEWRARVDAELGAYRERVAGLAPEIDELVHYRALTRLESSAERLAADVEALIAEATTDLLTRVHGRCRDLSGALHDASAHVAVAAAQTGDADRDVRILTETVRELVRRAPTYDAKAVHAELHRPRPTPAVLG